MTSLTAMRITFICLLGFLIQLLSSQTCLGGFRFKDPGIPDNETISYISKSENISTLIKERVRHIGPHQYEITSLSPALDTFLYINRADMTVQSVHTIQKYETATLDSNLIIKNAETNAADDSIQIPHFVALSHLLRGFPFETMDKLQIKYYGGSAGKKFKLFIKNRHKDTIQVMGKQMTCYKLEFGLAGFLGAILPELELWYSVDPPHYMIRYHGPEGPPGTPKRFIEIIDYRVP